MHSSRKLSKTPLISLHFNKFWTLVAAEIKVRIEFDDDVFLYFGVQKSIQPVTE